MNKSNYTKDVIEALRAKEGNDSFRIVGVDGMARDVDEIRQSSAFRNNFKYTIFKSKDKEKAPKDA